MAMKLKEIKVQVYQLSGTETTRQLKKKYPELTKSKDLRYKKHWQALLDHFTQADHSHDGDLSLKDLEESDKMLRESLAKVGAMAGLSKEEVEMDWQRIQLESQFSDIHIEEL